MKSISPAEILAILPPELQWNIMTFGAHPVAQLFKDFMSTKIVKNIYNTYNINYDLYRINDNYYEIRNIINTL
jgi:hypothetical protein